MAELSHQLEQWLPDVGEVGVYERDLCPSCAPQPPPTITM